MSDKLPENYFERFPDKMMGRINDLDDQSNDLSILNQIGKNEPYSIPEGYFEHPERFIPARQRKLYPWKTIAAVAASFLLLFIVSNQNNTTEPALFNETVLLDLGWEVDEIEELDERSDGELEAYMEDIIEDLADDEILELLESTI